MSKPSDVLNKKIKEMEQVIPQYLKSQELENVARGALVDFIKRVKRSIMPDLSQIPSLSDRYIKIREKNKSKLGSQGKPRTSNATATGQMLNAVKYVITNRGFVLFVDATSRSKELNGSSSKINNAEVAKYYSKNRDIFDFSAPELERLRRKVAADLKRLIRSK